jgi:IclR family transcriptional regulator, acetate operon repressor
MSSGTTSSTFGHAPTSRRRPADRRRHDGADPAYPSARRAFRIIDRVSHGGDGLEATVLAHALGISRSTCYQVLGILIDEGYLRRLPGHAGYALGPELERLYERSRGTSVEAVVGPVLGDLSQWLGCSAYFGVLTEDDDVVVAGAQAPPGGAPMGLPTGLRAPAHTLALGKVQIAAGGVTSIDHYIEHHRLDRLTRRTITDPVALEADLKRAHARGYATDMEEFAKGLFCIAVPVRSGAGALAGAIGLATGGWSGRVEEERLVDAVYDAARRATGLLHWHPEPQPSRRLST